MADFSKENLDVTLPPFDWSEEAVNALKPIEKNFYCVSPATENLTDEEIEIYRKENNIHVSAIRGEQAPKPVLSFEDSSFPEFIINQLLSKAFDKPTPIQSETWPILYSGRDLVGISETGSGKTVAFLFPLILHVLAQPQLEENEGPIALILAPTRELACQINREIDSFIQGSDIRSTALIGGYDVSHQQNRLTTKVDIVIATPGRLLHMMHDKKISLTRVSYLVFDEADRLLDDGFFYGILKIAQYSRPDKQVAMFSATWNEQVKKMAAKICKTDPVFIKIGQQQVQASSKVQQSVQITERLSQKIILLDIILMQLSNFKLKTVIFCNSTKTANELSQYINTQFSKLCKTKFVSEAIHAQKQQRERDEILTRFTKDDSDLWILIATDIVARGIDFRDVMYVINFDMPNIIDDYIHRIGRCGRLNTGVAYSFVNPKRFDYLNQLLEIENEKCDFAQLKTYQDGEWVFPYELC